MSTMDKLIGEIQREAIGTRKMLERVPEEKFEWQPHVKSMKLVNLASHIADIPKWAKVVITQDEFVFNKSEYKPTLFGSVDEMLAAFNANIAEAVKALQETSEEALTQEWRMRIDDEILFTAPRSAILRNMVCNHTYHHRGQLSVYLRLLEVPVPGVYGPSADEQ